MKTYYIAGIPFSGDYLMHHGIKGQKWGVRRFQNPDGTLTAAGKERYGKSSDMDSKKEIPDIQFLNKKIRDMSIPAKRDALSDSERKKHDQKLNKLIKERDRKELKNEIFRPLVEKAAASTKKKDKAYKDFLIQNNLVGVSSEFWDNSVWKTDSAKHYEEAVEEYRINMNALNKLRFGLK